MIDLANQIAVAWWDWMGSMLWQVSLLILIVSMLDMLLRKWAWPQVRYALWLLVIVKLLLPPTWTLSTSVIAMARPWAQQQVVQVLELEPAERPTSTAGNRDTLPGIPGQVSGTETASGSGVNPAIETDGAASGTPAWQLYAMAIWITGMLAFAIILLTRIAKLRRWHAQQKDKQTIPPWFHELLVDTAERLKLNRLPAIVFSAEAVTPAVYGLFRPVLLLPDSYTETLSREEAEHVLLHELAHLKRGDLWLHGLVLLLQIIYWFNPLLVWVVRQTKHVRELCCDLTIANLLREKTAKYRQTLLDTARELLSESLEPGMGLLGVFEEPFRLVARLRWLEKETWHRHKLMIATALAVTAIAIPCILPMAEAEAAGSSETQLTDEATRRLTPAGQASAEEVYYVQELTHTDQYILFYRVDRSLNNVSELWIGDQRAANMERGRTVLVDLRENKVSYINHDSKTYTEAPLQFEIMDYLSDEFQWRHPYPQTSGIVTETGSTKTILDKSCKEFDVTSWNLQGSDKVNPQSFKVWATTDLPFDPSPLLELLRSKRKYYNRDAHYMDELEKIDGLQMRVAFESGSFWSSREIASQVVEISKKRPPAGLFSIPEGYTRRDKLTREDF